MATITEITDLKTWRLARELNQDVFKVILSNESIKDFALKDQINRSCGSVMDNIAEGFGRGGNKEFINFLGFSLGSLSEVESQLFRAIDRDYISNKDYELIRDKVKNLRPMIISFSNYLRNSGFKGPKWKVEEPEGIYTKPKNQNPELKNQNLKPGTVNPHPKTLN